MAKIDITKTELVWPGKYDEKGQLVEVPRVNLPFQIIETIGQSRATREADKKEKEDIPLLYDVFHKKEGETFEEGWKNKLIWGDNLLVMGSLLEQFAGKIDLIYIDPPFATGADFSFITEIGDSGEEALKEQSIIEEKAYRDTWGRGSASYLDMMYNRITLFKDLLSDTGSVYIHVDYRMASSLRHIMDEVFGPDCLINEIVWHYRRWSNVARTFQRMHDNILFYSRRPSDYVFNLLYQKYAHPEWIEDTVRGMVDGRLVRLKDKKGEYIKRDKENVGVPMHDVWEDINFIGPTSQERLGYATQKPEALVERIILASSTEGSLVADLFSGSGTTCVVAEKMKRRYIGCDLSRWAIHTTRKRLLDIEGCKPFEILNLGKYERQYWQGVTFKKGQKEGQQLAIFEYLKFVLKLYGAEPLAGMEHLHGKKGGAVIHVGAVDAPVTIDEINACLDECKAIKQKELHILGWEWEMGLYEIITEAAKGRGIRLLLLQIPREVMEQQAVQKGDVRFFELAYLEVKIKSEKGRKVTVELKDFVIPNTELIPQEVRDKVKKWSDFIDYWAIDWDFRNDTFMQGWVDYRTRKNRSLSLKSDPHIYEKPGKYTIMVKVVDIFGNDTSQLFETEVK